MEFDPCPLCGAAVLNISHTFSEPVTHDLGYIKLMPGLRPVHVTSCDTPRVTSIMLEPCGCELFETEWLYLSMPGEPIHWMHPDEIDRFINDRKTDNA